MPSVLQNIYEGLLNLLYEPVCPFGIEHNCSLGHFCASDGASGKVCELCFNELIDIEIQSRRIAPLSEIYSVAKYLNTPKQLIHKLKWVNPKLAKPIAELMVFRLKHYDLQFDCIMPVPGLITEDRTWAPSILLAKEISDLLKIPYFDEVLSKNQETKFSKLSKRDRIKIVNIAYQRNDSINPKVLEFDSIGKKILLIDDLITSGATLKTCARALKEGNDEHKIIGLTFASVTET